MDWAQAKIGMGDWVVYKNYDSIAIQCDFLISLK